MPKSHKPPANHPWRVAPDRFFSKKSRRLNMVKDAYRKIQREESNGEREDVRNLREEQGR